MHFLSFEMMFRHHFFPARDNVLGFDKQLLVIHFFYAMRDCLKPIPYPIGCYFLLYSKIKKREEAELEQALALSLKDAEAAKEAAAKREADEAHEMELAVKESIAEKENWERKSIADKNLDNLTQQDVTSLVFGGLLQTV